ncbi:MAG: hypothetical protein H7832_01865 [Magnetococcus sp. DMHC-6]
MQTKRSSKKNAPPPILNLTLHGQTLLDKNQFKEAIEVFKKLAKEQPNASWREPLIKAYRGRALELAEKSMFKEALVTLENESRISGLPIPLDLILPLAVNTGSIDKLAPFFNYQKEASSLPPAHLLEPIQSLMAILALVGDSKIDKIFPKKDLPFWDHLARAREALTLYGTNQETLLDGALAKIPAQSPFKHFRLFLKSLSLINSQPEKATALLERIPPHTPFAGPASVVQVCSFSEQHLPMALVNLDTAAQSCVATLVGIDPNSISLLNKLNIASRSIPKLFSFLIAHTEQLNLDWVRTTCLELLSIYPEGVPAFEKKFGPLDPFQKNRFLALKAEKNQDITQAEKYWLQCISILKAKPNITEDIPLKIALILRHIHPWQENTRRRRRSFYFNSDEDQHEPFYFLEQSLTYDPDDPEVWIELIRGVLEIKEEKRGNTLLEKALKIFPDNPALLTIAVELALKRHTFVKAVRLAEKLLQINPINPHIRQQILRAQLSQAEKQIHVNRLDLAKKEIQKAEAMARNEIDRGNVRFYQGVLALKHEEINLGLALIQEARSLEGETPFAFYRMFTDAKRLGLQTKIIQQLQQDLRKKLLDPPQKQFILDLISQIDIQLPTSQKRGADNFILLEDYLTKGVPLNFTIQERQWICQRFFEADRDVLLKKFASEGEKQWPEIDCFFVYRLYVQYHGQYGRHAIPADHIQRLVQIYHKAEEKMDPDHLLDPIEEILPPNYLYEDEDKDEDEDEDDSPFLPNDMPLPCAPEELVQMVCNFILENDSPPKDINDMERWIINLMIKVDQLPIFKNIPPPLKSIILLQAVEKILTSQEATKPPPSRPKSRMKPKEIPQKSNSDPDQLKLDFTS